MNAAKPFKLAVSDRMGGRQDYIDLFRGLGILTMVMGHIGFSSYFDYFIHAFHMPMFFFVGGYFFSKKKAFGDFIIGKIKSLLLPYFFWGLVHFGIWYAFSHDKSLTPLINLLWKNTEGLAIAGALWFLTAYFFSQIIFYAIHALKRKGFCLILSVCIAIIGCILSKILPFRLPWALDAAFVGVGLMEAGYICRNKKDKFDKLLDIGVIRWLLLAALTTILISFNGYINMRKGIYAIVPLFWINALLAIWVGLSLCKRIEEKVLPKYWMWMAYCGKNSIVFVCLNQLMILVFTKILSLFEINIVIEKFGILVGSWACLMVIAAMKSYFDNRCINHRVVE